MNRSQRRAFARGKGAAGSAPADVVALMDEAVLAYRQGQRGQAAAICKQILTRVPEHAGALNLAGILHQAADNHRLAVKMLEKALGQNELDAACHYNIATSYQALGQPSTAATHFKRAIALGLSGRDVEQFLQQDEIIGRCVRRIMEDTPGQPIGRQARFDADDLAAIGANIFLRCDLQTNIVRGVPLELFLTSLRPTLLRLALADIAGAGKVDDGRVALFCALAQQCFLNEYVFAQSDEETRDANGLREMLSQKLSSESDIAPALLAAVAAYFPLHALPKAQLLLAAAWPDAVGELLQQQVRDPLEEAADKRAIPTLTPITDKVSQNVREQYEDNPYPRWTLNPLAGFANAIREQPQARLLAVDLSLSSLAYARRKTREEGVTNIEYAQADILNLQGIGRIFDRIESVG